MGRCPCKFQKWRLQRHHRSWWGEDRCLAPRRGGKGVTRSNAPAPVMDTSTLRSQVNARAQPTFSGSSHSVSPPIAAAATAAAAAAACSSAAANVADTCTAGSYATCGDRDFGDPTDQHKTDLEQAIENEYDLSFACSHARRPLMSLSVSEISRIFSRARERRLNALSLLQHHGGPSPATSDTSSSSVVTPLSPSLTPSAASLVRPHFLHEPTTFSYSSCVTSLLTVDHTCSNPRERRLVNMRSSDPNAVRKKVRSVKQARVIGGNPLVRCSHE